jgi:type II secretion system protein J
VGNVLQRRYQIVLDATSSSQPVIQNLLTNVNTIQINYLDQNHSWVPQWPAPLLPPTEGLSGRPLAVEILIDFKDWGKVRRLVEVAG